MGDYDVFICHASDDKQDVARPLSEFLRSFGLSVWYDEFALDVGDSLSRSIDKGLATSRFGVVVLSPSFFSKAWPQHELSGLVAKEVAYGKTILPIWHKISLEEIRHISPTLADKVAIRTDGLSIQDIGLLIIKAVRPEIFANLQRWVMWRNMLQNAPRTVAAPSDLKPSPIRHTSLPPPLLVRIRLVHAVLRDAASMDSAEMITNFQRDLHPSSEVAIWEHIACAYAIAVQRREDLSPTQRRALVGELLRLSFSNPEVAEIQEDSLLHVAVSAWVDAAAPIGDSDA